MTTNTFNVRHRKRWAYAGTVIVLGLIAVSTDLPNFASYAYNRLFYNNFHEIVPGRYYRSAQMPYADLAQTIRNFQIKTVLDLRKSWDEGKDGVNEEKIVTEHGAKYIRMRLGSKDVPTFDRLSHFVDILEHAEEPILVHCSDGTHRTGFVSFLWRVEVEKAPVSVAQQQLSAKYGYSGLEQWVKSRIMHKRFLGSVVWEYAEDYQKSPIDFLTWAKLKIGPQAQETVILGSHEKSRATGRDYTGEY